MPIITLTMTIEHKGTRGEASFVCQSDEQSLDDFWADPYIKQIDRLLAEAKKDYGLKSNKERNEKV